MGRFKTMGIEQTSVLLYKDWGVQSVLHYLFTVLNTTLTVDQIHCLLRSKSNLDTMVLAEVGTGVKTVSYSLPDIYSVLSPPTDPLDDYIVNNMETDERFAIHYNPINQYHSFMRVSLFETKEMVCFFGVWAVKKNAFTEEDSKDIFLCTRQLGESMLQDYSHNSQTFTHFSNSMLTDYTLLQMCTGLKSILPRIEGVSALSVPVLLTGETGVGKGLIARSIHELSPRREQPFVQVNCGAIPENLVESELFGHERGAFTGAVSPHKGVFEQAQNGTLFLDEIGELSLNAQKRFLQTLDAFEIKRVGGSTRIPLNVRIITATNKDLLQEVAKGEFRQDLYYRINCYPIHIPPLRDRKEDILTLSRHFLHARAKFLGIPRIQYFSEQEMHLLNNYSFPGNVRELEHLIDHALIDAHLTRSSEKMHYHFDFASEISGGTGLTQEAWPSLEDMEKRHIQATLQKTHGHLYGKNGAAFLLKIHPNTLKNKMVRYQI